MNEYAPVQCPICQEIRRGWVNFAIHVSAHNYDLGCPRGFRPTSSEPFLGLEMWQEIADHLKGQKNLDEHLVLNHALAVMGRIGR